MYERQVPEVLHLRDFSRVVRKETEQVAPPPAHSLVPAIVALQRTEARLDLARFYFSRQMYLDLVVHEREHGMEVTAAEDLIHEHGQLHVLARHPRAQYRVRH